MKCVSIWAIGIGLLVTAGLLTVPQGYAEQKDDDKPKCTLATLKGRYLFGGIATLLSSEGTEQSLLAVAGYHIFNGDGTGTDIVTSRNNGGLPEETNASFPIEYTVNANCSGTYTVPSVGLSFGIFIAPNGEELIVIGTDPGTILVQGPNRRVSYK
ncbi:MAG: hypothetical protein ACRERE_23545 [Candidatus Entotheonellia bacterium]